MRSEGLFRPFPLPDWFYAIARTPFFTRLYRLGGYLDFPPYNFFGIVQCTCNSSPPYPCLAHPPKLDRTQIDTIICASPHDHHIHLTLPL